MRSRPCVEIPAFLVLAILCAWISNNLAGPTRSLSWRRREPAAAPSTAPALPLVHPPSAAPLPPPTPAPMGKAVPPAARAKPAPAAIPTTLATDSPLVRFPVLTTEPQAELASDEAAWLHAHGALFVDARRTANYTEGHIPGARSLPAWEDGLPEKVDQLALFTPDLRQPVVVYCAGGDCQDSHLVAQKLWMAGFRNLRIYTGGYPDWVAKGGAAAKGDKP